MSAEETKLEATQQNDIFSGLEEDQKDSPLVRLSPIVNAGILTILSLELVLASQACYTDSMQLLRCLPRFHKLYLNSRDQ